MNILGINAYHGDAAACLIQEGIVTAACEEERFRRIKHCAGFPALAIESCLNQRKLSLADVDAIGISRNPKANLSKKLLYTIRRGMHMSKLVKSRLENASRIVHLKDELLRLFNSPSPSPLPLAPQAGLAGGEGKGEGAKSSSILGNITRRPALRAKIYEVEHHLAHMASSFFASPFDKAALLSVDGFGDFVSTKWGYGEGTNLKVLGQVEFPDSLGILYTAVTQYLGFPNYGDEYKVMALAAYGEPRFQAEFREIITPIAQKGFHLNLDYFVHHRDGIEMNWRDGAPHLSPCYSQKLIELFGPPRRPADPVTSHHQDLAASLQHAFEKIYFHLLNELYERTQTKNLCLAGGCAFNSVANGKIRECTPFERVFIQPAAGDAGTALGAALYIEHVLQGKPRRFVMKHAYLGPEFKSEQIKMLLEEKGLHGQELSEEELVSQAAQALADGKIVGWFQERMEFGPRALGNRSLLADPRRKEMKEVLNDRIKHRESFRPFAPSILAEDANEFFGISHPEPFMTSVCPIKPEKRSLIPAVTHVDGSGRLQTVDRETNPKFWSLIQTFKKLTGVPVVLNTSFNENEPIVCTPQHAIECFTENEIDCMAIGNVWFEREEIKRMSTKRSARVIYSE